jgi:hypothetical protein
MTEEPSASDGAGMKGERIELGRMSPQAILWWEERSGGIVFGAAVKSPRTGVHAGQG